MQDLIRGTTPSLVVDFSDGTESDIPVYFTDPEKTVVSATVDGVIWQAE